MMYAAYHSARTGRKSPCRFDRKATKPIDLWLGRQMHLLRFDSVPAWIAGVCSLWRDRLRMNPALIMCLPTGLTPAAVYAEMARSVREGDALFRGRLGVRHSMSSAASKPDDPGLTKNTLQRQLVSSIDLPADRFHFLDPHAEDLATLPPLRRRDRTASISSSSASVSTAISA